MAAEFAEIGRKQGLCAPYKVSTWSTIPLGQLGDPERRHVAVAIVRQAGVQLGARDDEDVVTLDARQPPVIGRCEHVVAGAGVMRVERVRRGLSVGFGGVRVQGAPQPRSRRCKWVHGERLPGARCPVVSRL